MATHTLTLDGFVPHSLNRLMRGRVRDRIRLAKGDRAVVGFEALRQRIPKAAGKRRVKVAVEAKGPLPDPDNLLKGLLDCLVCCGLLVDDAAAWCELGGVSVTRGPARRTVITLEDCDAPKAG